MAAVTFLGPTPYLSAADSPFPVDDSNSSFFLEDFEPDAPCLPGQSTFCGAIPTEFPGIKAFVGGGGLGSSVDDDDGVVDGSGAAGISASLTPISISGSFVFSALRVDFDAEQLGFFPNAVGLVLTEGVGENGEFFVYNRFGAETVFTMEHLILSGNDTTDDQFIGVVDDAGISGVMFATRVRVTDIMQNTRVDHLQYGLLIPEPAPVYPALVGVFAYVARRRRRAVEDRLEELLPNGVRDAEEIEQAS
jgi:hypothetical protein